MSLNGKVLVWLFFNSLLLVFFGILHQAGVSRALHWLNELPPSDRTLLFTHTYMPPVSSLLLAPSSSKKGKKQKTHWISEDLKGSPIKDVVLRVMKELKPGHEVYIVSPGTVHLLPSLRSSHVGGSGRGALGALNHVIQEEDRKTETKARESRERGAESVRRVARLLLEAEAELEVAEKTQNKKWLCPGSKKLMKDPVSAADGHTYERAYITAHIEHQQTRGLKVRSPVTEQPLQNTKLNPNHILRMAIKDAVNQTKHQSMALAESQESSHSAAAPPHASNRQHVDASAPHRGGCEVVKRFFPHLSMEDLPGVGSGLEVLWQEMSLEVIRCRWALV